MAMTKIKAVVFDAFGTLVEITAKTRPFAELLRCAQGAGSDCGDIDGTVIMSRDINLSDVAMLCNYEIPPDELGFLENQLANELASIRLFPEVCDVLLELRQRNYELAVCSNLASPYGPRVRSLLPFTLDAYTWSYSAGAVKPNPAIYKLVCDTLEYAPEEVLFVGDTYQADYLGPIRFGMNARHLKRGSARDIEHSISDLRALLEII